MDGSGPVRVVLIEDAAADRWLFSEALRAQGVEARVLAAGDAERAIELLGALAEHPDARPDLVVVDLGLPRGDGRDVIAAVRDDDRLAGAHVVLLTGDAAYRADGGDAPDEYFVKPALWPGWLDLAACLRARLARRAA